MSWRDRARIGQAAKVRAWLSGKRLLADISGSRMFRTGTRQRVRYYGI
jgi:hypothetical protein